MGQGCGESARGRGRTPRAGAVVVVVGPHGANFSLANLDLCPCKEPGDPWYGRRAAPAVGVRALGCWWGWGGGGGVTAGAPAPFPLACTESGGGNRLLLQGKVGGMWIVEGLPKPILLGGVVCT